MFEVRASRSALFHLVLVIVAFWALLKLWPVLVLVLIALMFVVGLLPYVESLVQKGVPRELAVIGILVAFLAVLLGVFALVIPAMVQQFGSIRDNLPESARQLERLLSQIGIDVELQQATRDINWDRFISGRAAIDYGQRALGVIVSIVTIIVMTAYLLMDTPKLARFAYQFLPADRELEYDRLFQSACRVVGGYLRGQFVTSLAITAFTFVVLTIVGIPNALAFAVLAGLADVIPLVGALIAIIPVFLIALNQSSTQALIVLVALMAYQQVEDKFIVPRVYGQTLNLPPIIVLIAALAGGELMGLTGALLALPIAAVGRVWLDYYLEKRGVSLSPVEESEETPEAGDELFAPDTKIDGTQEDTSTVSIIALSGHEPRTEEEGASSSEDDSPDVKPKAGAGYATTRRKFRRRARVAS
jgi:predicted PurR-regulated permease PerM